MNDLIQLTNDFRKIVRARQFGYVSAAELVLAEIARIQEPRVVSALAGCFDDTVDHEELMFSIIHTMEMWDDDNYSREIVGVVEQLWRASPRWAQIIHIRILNSGKTLDAYLRALTAAGEEKRVVVREIYKAVAQHWPKLAVKAQNIIERLG